MSATDMTAWNSLVVERFKILLDVKEISGEISDEGIDGDDDDAKLERAAIARNRNAMDVRIAHDALAALAFSGYDDWCEYDDDDWTKNCLSQVISDQQSSFLVSALEAADMIGLTSALSRLAGEYRREWELAAEAISSGRADDDAEGDPELNAAENTESWKYSRTPGTRYYIFYGGKYLYSDDKDAPVKEWASAEIRDNDAARHATEWESGSGIFYTPYENPEHVDGASYIFGRSKDGPWTLTRSQAEHLLIESRQSPASGGVAASGSSIEPYYDTGHFTRYANGVYTYGETADAASWYATYDELLTAIGADRDDEDQAEDDDIVTDEDVDELMREADESGDDAYRLAVSFLGKDEVRRLAAEIAAL